MAKKAFYVCKACHAAHPKWAGRCESCGEWNSIELQTSSPSECAGSNNTLTSMQAMHSIETNCCRNTTGYQEFDKILGGGIVAGSVILVGGEPGVGKSTLITQVAININNSLYISAEESIEQISLRIKRMTKTNNNTFFASTAKLEDVISFIESSKANFVLIDSIQTIYSSSAPSTPGSITQVRYCAHKLIEFTKALGITLLIISHVNKDGQIAGPKVLEHMVDTVLYFEGDAYNHHRILRTVKNRFGPANEIAVFSMHGSGLQEISNPSSAFISEHAHNASGSVIFAGIEGTRPILLEIQALLSPTYMATPRRAVVGWDINRLAMIAAILNTRCGIFLSNKEIYLNVAGGFKITETAADMAVAAALISAALNKVLPPKTVVFGEISLSGSSRKAQQSEKRLQESQRLGFCNAIVPSKENVGTVKFHNMIAISHIAKLKSYIEQL